MKYFITILFCTFSFFACSDDSSSNAKTENNFSLRLNENCKELKPDAALLNAIDSNDLKTVKELLSKCSSLDNSIYDSIKYYSDEDVIWYAIGDKKDSMVMYLVENGLDSAAIHLGAYFASEAMMHQDTVLVRYAIEKNLPIDGSVVYWAIKNSAECYFGFEQGKYWYETLLPYVPSIDSVRQGGSSPQSTSILQEFCSEASGHKTVLLSEEEQLFYFKDIVDRGHSVNIADCHNLVLEACNYGKEYQTELQKKFSNILIAAGADTSLVYKN